MTDAARRTPGRDAPAVQLSLMGGFEIRVAGQACALPLRAQQVVAFLALRGRTGRSRIAGSLWADTTETRALGNLRTAVWRANQVVADLVIPRGSTLGLAESTRVDVHQIGEESRSLLGGERSPDAAVIAMLRERAELLPDWNEEWLGFDREQLRQLSVHVCEQAAERFAAAGRYGLALDLALSAAGADPLRESAHRLILEIHLAEGNHAAARRSYLACVAYFEREIGARPSFRLEDLSRARRIVPAQSRVAGDVVVKFGQG